MNISTFQLIKINTDSSSKKKKKTIDVMQKVPPIFQQFVDTKSLYRIVLEVIHEGRPVVCLQGP
jgi:hypothetical protein